MAMAAGGRPDVQQPVERSLRRNCQRCRSRSFQNIEIGKPIWQRFRIGDGNVFADKYEARNRTGLRKAARGTRLRKVHETVGNNGLAGEATMATDQKWQQCLTEWRASRSHRTPRASRDGVLLLVVLSMLVLFMLIGTAFLMSSSQEQKTAKNLSKVDRVGNYGT